MEKTPFPFHPEPHSHEWSALELAAILKYGQACAKEAASECAKICEDIPTPADIKDNSDGRLYEIATLDCESAIKARFGLDVAGVKE